MLLTSEDAKKSNPMQIIRYLIKAGKEEGIIIDKYSDSYMETAMFSRIIGFVVYVDNVFGNKDCDNDVIKQSLYEGLCRELGV